ncbi:hypothetical protein [Martelella alba]|uniref:Uncharacterized protein n=1 Tax=Martelella alba TaxID=2590451 RepID=A0ABY2SFS1_9HYPH|nr:hypothetical protein [Martelella alba]TKI03581.1 hypothetical protein FCN80_21120 [Martelella alba]
MNTVLLVVILISGYIYVTLSLSARYIFKRSTGWDAYFFVAAWGTFFVTLSWGICSLLSVLGFFRWAINDFLHLLSLRTDVFQRIFPISTDDAARYKDLKFAFWGVLSLLLACASGALRKWRIKGGTRRIDALVKAVGDNALENLLMEASVRQFPVIITLKSRKFYVGFIHCPAFEQGASEFLELLPLLSGYRDKDDLTIHVTTNYQKHYINTGIQQGIASLDLSDFRTLVPKGEIEGISFFDTDTYSKFKEEEEKDKAESKSLSENFMPAPDQIKNHPNH